MPVLRDVLIRLDRTLDSVIKQPVRFMGAPVENQEEKMKAFDKVWYNMRVSETQVFRAVDQWLFDCNRTEKEEFCQYIYDNILQYNRFSYGRAYIELYCMKRNITLKKNDRP